MDISKMTDITELKALAFDQRLIFEQAQANYQMILQRIQQLEQQHPPKLDKKKQ